MNIFCLLKRKKGIVLCYGDFLLCSFGRISDIIVVFVECKVYVLRCVSSKGGKMWCEWEVKYIYVVNKVNLKYFFFVIFCF